MHSFFLFKTVGTLFSAVAGSADPVSAIVFAQFLTIFTLGDPDEQTRLSIVYAGAFVGIGAAAFISYTMEVRCVVDIM